MRTTTQPQMQQQARRTACLQQANSLAGAPLLSPTRKLLEAPRRTAGRGAVKVRALESGYLAKLGRVLKEKAAGDLGRVFRGGTSKARERLGVVEEMLALWTLEGAEESLEELEEALIASDFGPRTALRVVDSVREAVREGRAKTSADIREALKASLLDTLTYKVGVSASELNLGDAKPAVVLIVGVNGGGKTTSIGKLSHQLAQQGAKVVLAAGDTFRAAASEQLREWADRSGATFVGPQAENTRPATVLYKAVEAGRAEGADVVLCDTSGRLHTNVNLMEELASCRRALEKAAGGCPPQEVLLVLDGTTGLNMLNQAREFHETVGLTGIVLTKLDGTARGGAVVSVVDELSVPIKFVGVGEGLDDLQPFDAAAFIEGLFPSWEGEPGAGAEAAAAV